MKKLYILLITLFGMTGAKAQPHLYDALRQGCLPQGITFTTQEQIDNFQANYPGCTEIDWHLTINGNNITNLTGLNVVTSIGGSLSIWGNNALNSLTGLENLTSIVGGLYVYSNDELTSLSGLGNLTTIGGNIWIGYNPSLVNLAGLENLTSIGGYFEISYNTTLIGIAGLESLTSIGAALLIADNAALTGLSGIESLTSLVEIQVSGNIALTSLSGLENIDAGSLSNLSVYNNSLLSTCHVQSICNYLIVPNGTIEIHDNAPGCNSPEEVIQACQAIAVGEIDMHTGFSIIPNPAIGIVTVSCPAPDGIAWLTLFNTDGGKVLEQRLSDTETQLDISALPQGVHFVRVQNERFVETVKMIKQ